MDITPFDRVFNSSKLSKSFCNFKIRSRDITHLTDFLKLLVLFLISINSLVIGMFFLVGNCPTPSVLSSITVRARARSLIIFESASNAWILFSIACVARVKKDRVEYTE